MSSMSDLWIEIEELSASGMTVQQIVDQVNGRLGMPIVTVAVVSDVVDMINEQDNAEWVTVFDGDQ